MKKVCYFSNVFFPKNPYLDYNLFYYLHDNNINITFILKDDDIRLHGIKNKKTLISFNHKDYKNIKNIIIIKEFDELIDITKNFDLFLCTNLVIDRLKINHEIFFKLIQTKKCIIDVCGYDIVKKGYFNLNIDYFLVKGKIMKEWLIKMEVNKKNIYVVGSPLFDYCNKHKLKKNLISKSKIDFYNTYDLDQNKKTLLLTTTNLRSSRTSMNSENYNEIKSLYYNYKDKYNFILLSYPLDYLFYEIDIKFRRSENKDKCPDYKYLIKNFKNLKVINANENYDALKYCDYIFHLSAGALSIETILLYNKISFTMHFKDKDYYKKKVGYSQHIEFPDDKINIHLNKIEDIFNYSIDNNQINNTKKCIKDFILIDDAHKNILESIIQILNELN